MQSISSYINPNTRALTSNYKNTVIKDSVIMPNAKIGDNIKINKAIVGDSVIIRKDSTVGNGKEIVVVPAKKDIKANSEVIAEVQTF